MMCYKIALKLPSVIHSEDNMLMTNNLGTIFFTSFNQKYVSYVERMSLYAHQKDSILALDNSLSLNILLNDTKHIIRLSYHTLEVRKLEPPYDTQCYKYPAGYSQLGILMERIHNKTMMSFNKSIPGLIQFKPIDNQPIQYHVLQLDREKWEKYLSIVKESKHNIPPTCEVKTAIPKTTILPYSFLAASLTWPDGFYISTSSNPKLDLIEYVIYISSCIGIWLGLSFLDLFRRLKLLKEKFYPSSLTSPDIGAQTMYVRRGMNRYERMQVQRMENQIEFIKQIAMNCHSRLRLTTQNINAFVDQT